MKFNIDKEWAQIIHRKVIQLEITGETKCFSEREFNEVKARIEEDNAHRSVKYGLRRCPNSHYKCETYIVR